MEVEGIWIWINNRQRLTFTDWGLNQPSDYQNHQDCLHLYAGADFHWHDLDCSMKAYFICEKP